MHGGRQMALDGLGGGGGVMLFAGFDDRQMFVECGHEGRRRQQGEFSVGQADQADARPPLIFTESRAFAERGAAVSFYIVRNRLKLRINLAAVEEAGVTIHPRLLNLGSVERYRPEETGR